MLYLLLEDQVLLYFLFGNKLEMYFYILYTQGKAKVLAVFVASLMHFADVYKK